MDDIEKTYWKKCSACKTEIGYSSKYYECSVSTCRGKRTGLVFCSVPCWERHLPTARHKDAGAIEEKAPSFQQYQTEQKGASGGQKRIVRAKPASSSPSPALSSANSHEILIVASKLKQYIKDRADMNTSQSVMSVLSDIVRRACDQAIDKARQDGRKTVLDRDFK